jgi:myo-inositol-1(or 4)-monophosphatase
MDDQTLALDLARAGAAVVRSAMSSTVSYKSDSSPVTDVDAAAEATIKGMLAEARPDDAVVAEESGVSGEGGRRWYIDPLDGTVNFINGIPQVAVSVGLWDSDIALVGAIVDVFRGEEFTVGAGKGAFLGSERLRASGRRDLHPAVVATGFPYDHREAPDRYASALRNVLAKVQGLRRFGSAALDLAWTAAGRFDGYYETGVAPWDIAAGLLLVTEAGGVATDFAGLRATPSSPAVVAAGPGIHAELRELVAAAGY